ncbi:MAG TPA: TlpA disulfide reductase family protein [Candidatus Limnocylindria bacterium]|nr:TlpA disulfide reductase family protein [Candidatus Limnocylindria bacterium]
MASGRGLRVLVGTLAIGVLLAGGLAWLRGRTPTLAPDFSVVDLSGKTVRLSALRGKVVLVNVWTTWCPPCREEMPSMERLYRQLAGPDFELLAVSEDEGGIELVREFVHDLDVSFPVLYDPERQVGSRFGVWGYPETFVIDRAGYVVERVIGPRVWDAPEQVAALRALMQGGAAAARPQ